MDVRKRGPPSQATAALVRGDSSANDATNEVGKLFSSKNLIRAIVKLFFGSSEESAATSRQLLTALVGLLDTLRAKLGPRARSAGPSSRPGVGGLALAGAAMARGYLRGLLTSDEACARRNLCLASQEAVGESRDVGFIVAQFGGYAASYALESQKSLPFDESFQAAKKGRNGENCYVLYQQCKEAP
ncbi:hypothetical protein LAZ67_7003050 [Cordylochernes scorpioides]|uniref:Uncharacterized protein n=1 Tax=Cordylochernes scorpioides TaxID=51811 RepID=A0ABY6KNL0_9ARAC|nr:hypothetical protein LAZ67_7003050 [Cordylochernes scorpioides]